MPPIVTTAEIDRPAAEVFACATDPARFGQRQKGMEDGHMDATADGMVPAVGTRCVTTRRIGPIRAAVDVLVEPVTGSRSRLTISVDFTGHGIGKVLVPLMVRRQARKEMLENMARLKRLIEES